jgi:hypothetical protein
MSKVVRIGFRRQLKLVIQHVVENVLAHGKQLNQLEETQLAGLPNMKTLWQWEVANQQQILIE